MASRPDPALADGLLRTARRLIPQGQKPDQARLRRSVSSSYYAMFHGLARMCADSLVGTQQSKRSNKAWVEVYRGLAHTACLEACKNAHMVNFPQEVKDFADAFKQLQESRHIADYDPTARFTKDTAEEKLGLAEISIGALKSISSKNKKAFATWVLITSHGAKQARKQARHTGTQ